MVKKALSPIVAKLSEWFFIFEAAHAQLSMIFLCSSLLCCDFFHETRLLATDSKRNQLPSLVSSARNSFRFLIHSHFHLPMLFSWFFSLFFSFFFFDFTVVATAAFCITDYCEILCHFAAWLAASFFPRLLRRQTHTHFWSVPWSNIFSFPMCSPKRKWNAQVSVK